MRWRRSFERRTSACARSLLLYAHSLELLLHPQVITLLLLVLLLL